MKAVLKWMLISVAALIVITYVALSILAGGPKDAIQMVRFALPYMHRGMLKVGDSAPDVRLMALDGQSRFQLRERLAGKPLVLVFGSFT
ncbi:MAG TPA: hypothetical protein VEI54_00935 [Candidatus Limnocylindrales bacterium]|nr:hypothetical protein [Candidatus Limnocylindrales bacterium]